MVLVPYYRVSSKKQGKSGLGLEAQMSCVAAYAKATGATVGKAFIEVETGKRAKQVADWHKPISQLISNRPQLQAAIEEARRLGARLIIGKLDRLARDVAVTSCLAACGVDFVACDNPNANTLTINILASVAQEEARLISERTKAALAKARERGKKLGAENPQCRNLTQEARVKGSLEGRKVWSEQARERAKVYLPLVTELRGQGLTLQAIAQRLNEEGYRTPQGKLFTHVQVLLLLRKAEAK